MLKYASQFMQLKMIIAILFGLANGIPLGLIGSSLKAWLAVAGISRSSIGFFTLIATPYALKFLWAPFIENIRIPLLSKVLGHRKSWLFITQIMLSISIINLGFANPVLNIYHFAQCAFIVSALAAFQETIIDAFRVDMLEKEQQCIGATSASFGHSIGVALASGATLLIADLLCNSFEICDNFMNWSVAYTVFAVTIFLASFLSLLIKEPEQNKATLKHTHNQKSQPLSTLYAYFVEPFGDFTKRYKKHLLILSFITLYRVCDAFIMPMTNPFLLDIGFSLTEIALVVKTFGFIVTAVGSIIGGMLIYRIGMINTLFICTFSQMLSNFMFIVQANAGHNINTLYFLIAAENLGSGMGISVFISYISYLCSCSKYTTTQYSLLAALSASGYFASASFSGVVAESFGWVPLFSTSILLGIPPIIILYFLREPKE